MSSMIVGGLFCALLVISRDAVDTLKRLRSERARVLWAVIWLLPALLAAAAVISLLVSRLG